MEKRLFQIRPSEGCQLTVPALAIVSSTPTEPPARGPPRAVARRSLATGSSLGAPHDYRSPHQSRFETASRRGAAPRRSTRWRVATRDRGAGDRA